MGDITPKAVPGDQDVADDVAARATSSPEMVSEAAGQQISAGAQRVALPGGLLSSDVGVVRLCRPGAALR